MLDERQVTLTKSLMAHFESLGVSRRHFLRLLATAGAGASLSALIAACGGDDDDDESDDSSGGVEPTATDSDTGDDTGDEQSSDEPAATPAESGNGGGVPAVLVVASGQDISNLDPHTGHDYSIASTQKSVYDTLLRYQGNPPELEFLLATDYEANEDATEWTFNLDVRAVFHDGTPVTADDIVYNVGRLIRKNQGPAWMFTNFLEEDGAEAIDDHTVKITLLSPFSPLPLILPWLFIVNQKVVAEHETDGDEGEGWLVDHEAGSGPFVIKSWNVGDSYEFEALPDYWWGWPEEGHLSGYIWRIIRESSSARLALLSGDAQMAFDLGAEDIAALIEEPGFIVNEEPGLGVFSLKLNNQSGPTADVNVRRAISYAMDYEAVIDALNDRATLLEGPLPNLGEFNNPDLDLYRLDLDKAREALAASPEFAEGGFEIEYVYVTGLQIEEQIGLILLDNLSELNITLNMQPLVWPDMVARAQDIETAPHIMAVYAGTSYGDPDNFLWQAYHSSQAGFWAAASHYMNPDFDKLLEDARATPDHDERVSLYHQAQETLVNDAVDVWIQSEFAGTTYSDRVGGYVYTPIMGFYLQPLWLNPE